MLDTIQCNKISPDSAGNIVGKNDKIQVLNHFVIESIVVRSHFRDIHPVIISFFPFKYVALALSLIGLRSSGVA